MIDPPDLVRRVFEALLRGELRQGELTARKLSAWLGYSTIALYHHFGSLDGFLVQVDGAGWRLLLAELERIDASGGDLESLAIAYVDFAERHRDLYWLMTERPFDRARLREEGRLRAERPLLASFAALLARHGSAAPARDTLVVFAALHGLASLSAGGRLDLGAERKARARLRDAARDIARLVSGRR